MSDEEKFKKTAVPGEQIVSRSATEEEILRAVKNVRFGSVEITIHDAKVVQVERREKIRFQDRK